MSCLISTFSSFLFSSSNLHLPSLSPSLCLLYSAIEVSSPSEQTEPQQTVIVSEPEPDPPAAPPSDPAPSEVSEAAVTTDQETPAAPSQGKENLQKMFLLGDQITYKITITIITIM